MRLSISNSKNTFIISIILLNTLLIILFSEYFYCTNNVPVFIGKNQDMLVSQSKFSQEPLIFIIGDSRADAGVIPELIDSVSSYSSYNLGLRGIYKGYYNKIKFNNINPNKIIVAVSPYSVFNNFKLKKDNLFNKVRFIRKPFEYTENYFSSIINRYTHLHYGFMGVSDVLKYKKVSEYFTKKGWHGYDRLGSDAYYTYMVNLESYRHKIIEEYKDASKIGFGKRNFEEMLVDMSNNNYSVLFIRIPISNEIRKIEDEKYPWFSSYIGEIINQYNYDYIEFNDFEYPKDEVDGSHLNRNSAKEFTKELIKLIE